MPLPLSMRALCFDGGLTLTEMPCPETRAGHALMRMTLAGICRTDLEIIKGYMGFSGILGHEFTAQVVNSADPSWQDARVVGEINLGCGECVDCRRGLGRHCAERTVLGIAGHDGALAEFLSLPLGNLQRIPDGLNDDAAVFAEPLAAALEIGEQIHLQPGSRALVLGDGKLGLLVVQVLLLAGQRVTLCGHHSDRASLARGWGAEARHDSGELDGRWDLVVEATGSSSGLQTAIAHTRPRGTLVLKSTYAGKVELDAAPLVIDEIRVVGSRCGPFAPAVDLLTRGLIDTASLISGRYPLSQGLQAFEHAQRPGALKVLVEG